MTSTTMPTDDLHTTGVGTGHESGNVVSHDPSHATNAHLTDPEKVGSVTDSDGLKDEKSILKDSDSSNGIDIDFESVATEEGHDIHYRTMSWQKAAGLLFGEYICLAIVAFPYSFQLLGYAGGTITVLLIALSTQYTSLTMWRLCMQYPGIRDIVDCGYILFGRHRAAYEIAFIGFLLNNVFIMALHTVTGSLLLNTLSNHSICTAVFSVIFTVICWLFSLPRTLAHVSIMGVISACFMFVAVILNIVFAQIDTAPYGFPDPTLGNEIIRTAWAPTGTTFTLGMGALLNITFTFIGQATIPSFIAEMKDPKDFPKALWACTICETILFMLAGVIIYAAQGQYVQAPAFLSIGNEVRRKIAFAFTAPAIIVIGVIYASVIAKFCFNRLFRTSHHRYSNTWQGWVGWAGILAVLWGLAFIIGQVVPFFSDLLSIMSALFDSWFGYIFWALAYRHIAVREGRSIWSLKPWVMAETLLNILILLTGIWFFTAGTVASILDIVDNYNAGAIKRTPFTCANNGDAVTN